MDPQTYFRWKQQKYKTSRSNAGTALGGNYVGVPPSFAPGGVGSVHQYPAN